MIKYEGVENKYLYDSQIIDKIIEMIDTNSYYYENECTQESVSQVVNAVNSFINSINTVEQKVMLERRETEEEARAYFGEVFIKDFDRLMTALDKQQTMVALHGTNIGNCPSISENGLQYKNPSLTLTAVLQDMAYGQRDIHYNNYEGLLNWIHHQYKGIVVLAVPYECFYKEGLWRKYQDTGTAIYGGQDYKIDPDFIAGYIDVENKKIVLNPKYNRKHNYEEYLNDYEIFSEKKDIDNNTFAQKNIEQKQKDSNVVSNVIADKDDKENKQYKVDVSSVPAYIEAMLGTFRGIKYGFPDGMPEEEYKRFLEELTTNFKIVQEALPQLKTNKQVQLEKEEEEKRWIELCKNSSAKEDDSLWDQWCDWDDTEEEQKNKKSL